MSAINTISLEKFVRLVGTPGCPATIDVRDVEREDPWLIPGSLRRKAGAVAGWSNGFSGQSAIVVCEDGLHRSAGVAAWLRRDGIQADILDGGARAWKSASLPCVPESKLPRRDADGRTVWVTRARPKVDRIACPWLIRRFVDPAAVFLFVAPGDVQSVAGQFDAAPFDVEGAFWSHRAEQCTFDTMLLELGFQDFQPLCRLAPIIRGADTDRLNLAPQAAGLLALSLGLSRMFADDHGQLEAGLLVYDALYRWCRDATDETHNWASHTPRR